MRQDRRSLPRTNWRNDLTRVMDGGAVPEDVFEARAVSKRFGVVQALENVSIGVGSGQVHALVGENGAGKSTLMNLFCGKLRPDQGELLVGGAPVVFASPLDAQAAGIAISPQEINLVPALSVVENVLLGAQVQGAFGIDWAETRARAIRKSRRNRRDDRTGSASPGAEESATATRPNRARLRDLGAHPDLRRADRRAHRPGIGTALCIHRSVQSQRRLDLLHLPSAGGDSASRGPDQRAARRPPCRLPRSRPHQQG